MAAEQRLQELGITLPVAPLPRGSYVPALIHGSLCFAAGQLPLRDGDVAYRGKLGRDVSVEEGKKASRIAVLNALAACRAAVHTLDDFVRVVRLTGYVNSADDFTEQHLVVNGASDVLHEIFGENGAHARTSIGLNALPLGAAVEIEIILALKDG